MNFHVSILRDERDKRRKYKYLCIFEQTHFARSVSRSRPPDKRMRLDSTARSRSRSMSKAPRNEMGVKDDKVKELDVHCDLVSKEYVITLLFSCADEEEVGSYWSEGSEE